MSTEVPEMYRSNQTLKELSELPAHVLAQELLHMAERAENSSTKNFLHYKFMPDNAALELGVHTLLDQGFRLNAEQSSHLASRGEIDDEHVGEDDCLIDFGDDADDGCLVGFDEHDGEDGAAIPRLMPTLAFSPELSYNLGGGGPLHRLIIGDNYHALAGLQASLATNPDGVYDLIYIDPPYNTGEGFTYNDNNVDKDDPWRSTKWSSIMEPRLRLSHRLMKDTGVIFISIDDNELYSLKLLCDSVFGRQNFLENIIWDSPGSNSGKTASGGVNYMLVYAKNRTQYISQLPNGKWVEQRDGQQEMMALVADIRANGGTPVDAGKKLRAWISSAKKDKRIAPGTAVYSRVDEQWRVFTTGDLTGPAHRRNMVYAIVDPKTGIEYHPPTYSSGSWRWSEDRMRRAIESGDVYFGGEYPRLKRYLSDYESTAPRAVFESPQSRPTKHLQEVLGEKKFDYPKDHTVLARWFRMAAPKDAKILDFFGGSGSTAEAVLALNVGDGGTREVTIVTNDENTIGTRITRERIVRVMSGDNWADGKSHEGYGGRLGVWRVDAAHAVDFTSTADEGLHHSWNAEAGKWGAWQDTPLLHRADDYYDVYADGDGAYSLVFHDIDHLKGALVDEALGEFPDAQVFLPYQHVYKTSRGFYVDDVPNAVPLPLGVVSPIQNGVADSMLSPYVKRGGGSYLDRIAALTGLSDDERES